MGCGTGKLSCIDTIGPRCTGMENIFQLYRAIQQCNFGKARHLILRGTNVNCINYFGGTSLIETCRSTSLHDKERERESFVRFLTKNGSTVDLSDISGRTAGFYASENGHMASVSLLDKLEREGRGKYIKY